MSAHTLFIFVVFKFEEVVAAIVSDVYDRDRVAALREMMAECCFTSTETVGVLGTGAQDVHLDFHTAPEL